jgi:hypothetical protein
MTGGGSQYRLSDHGSCTADDTAPHGFSTIQRKFLNR